MDIDDRIKQAAKKYMSDFEEGTQYAQRDFIAGANWMLEHLKQPWIDTQTFNADGQYLMKKRAEFFKHLSEKRDK